MILSDIIPKKASEGKSKLGLSERILEAGLVIGLKYRWMACGLFLWGYCGSILPAQSVEIGSGETAYAEWIRQLDSTSWLRREQAWQNLRLEAGRIRENLELAEFLEAVRDGLADPKISFEVQERLLFLEREIFAEEKGGKRTNFKVQNQLNERGESEKEFGKGGMESLPCWKMLFSDVPVERNFAEREVNKLLRQGVEPYHVMTILRNLLVKEDMSEDDRERMWKLEHQARLCWIKETAKLPKLKTGFSTKEIQESVDCLATANLPEDRLVPWMELEERCRVEFTALPREDMLGGDGFSFLNFGKKENGEIYGLKIWKTVQYLEDALIDESVSETALEAIREKLESKEMTPAGTILLKRLEFLTKPCLVAEYWREGEMKGVQFLRIGVPQNCGVGISYFDVLGEETVHCQGGANLAQGDYPLDVAVPHPNQPEAFFRLTALRTPAEKLLYPTIMADEDSALWREVTLKTMDWLEKELFEKSRPLSMSEIQLLGHLEMQEVSARVGEWFSTEEKWKQIAWEEDQNKNNLVGKQTNCAYLCELLFRKGTKEAIPGLLKMAEQDIFWVQTRSRERIAYWAILGISQNEPWEGMETWLLSQLGNGKELQEVLVEEDDSPMVRTMLPANGVKRGEAEKGSGKKNGRATVGATAAAILLKKQGMVLDGIREIPIRPMNRQGGIFYGFENDEAAECVCGKLRRAYAVLKGK